MFFLTASPTALQSARWAATCSSDKLAAGSIGRLAATLFGVVDNNDVAADGVALLAGATSRGGATVGVSNLIAKKKITVNRTAGTPYRIQSDSALRIADVMVTGSRTKPARRLLIASLSIPLSTLWSDINMGRSVWTMTGLEK